MGTTIIGKRNFGIDALRILSMYMIVILHLLGRGKVLGWFKPFSFEYAVVWFLEIAAYCAVNCYALISGYVGITSRYKYSNFIMLWLQIVFYTLGISILMQIITPQAITYEYWVSALFPIMTGQYWYLTAYAGLFLVMPILNIAINKIDSKTLIRVVVGCCLFASILPMIFRSERFDGIALLGDGYSALWLMVMYLIGGTIRRLDLFAKIRKRTWAVVYIVSVVIMTIGQVVFSFYGKKRLASVLVSYLSPFVILNAIALLMIFSKLSINVKIEKVIKFFAPLSLAVYIIHSCPVISEYFGYIFPYMREWPFISQIIWGLLIGLGIYLVCSLIDYVRLLIFEKLKLRQKIVLLLSVIGLEDWK